MTLRTTALIVVLLISTSTLAQAQPDRSPLLAELNAIAQRQLRERAMPWLPSATRRPRKRASGKCESVFWR